MKLISHTRHYMPNVNLKKTYNIMRLSVVLCMLSLFCASAKTGYSQVAEISLNLHNVTISEALEEIKHQSEYSFWYKNDELHPQFLLWMWRRVHAVFFLVCEGR